eukprot:7376711-Prymnesium_polylepis.1
MPGRLASFHGSEPRRRLITNSGMLAVAWWRRVSPTTHERSSSLTRVTTSRSGTDEPVSIMQSSGAVTPTTMSAATSGHTLPPDTDVDTPGFSRLSVCERGDCGHHHLAVPLLDAVSEQFDESAHFRECLGVRATPLRRGRQLNHEEVRRHAGVRRGDLSPG